MPSVHILTPYCRCLILRAMAYVPDMDNLVEVIIQDGTMNCRACATTEFRLRMHDLALHIRLFEEAAAYTIFNNQRWGGVVTYIGLHSLDDDKEEKQPFTPQRQCTNHMGPLQASLTRNVRCITFAL